MTSAMTRLTLILAVAALLDRSAHAQQAAERSFATPQEAAQALVDAAGQNDTAALLKLFGPQGTDIVQSGDPAEDKDSTRRIRPPRARKDGGSDRALQSQSRGDYRRQSTIGLCRSRWFAPRLANGISMRREAEWRSSRAAWAATNWLPSTSAAATLRLRWNTPRVIATETAFWITRRRS